MYFSSFIHDSSGLQLNPAAERIPSDVLASDELDPDGANLATVLARLKAETSTADRPNGALADIKQELSQLIPDVLNIEVERNEAARQFQLFVTMRDGARFGSRVLSDGTLRVIALLTVLHDNRRRGVLCFEEPENGIHEARVEGLIDLLRSSCTDLRLAPVDDDDTLTQVIVNTHSPVVLSHLEPDEIIGADVVSVLDLLTKTSSRKTRMRKGAVEELPLNNADTQDGLLTRYETLQLLKREQEQAH